MFIPVHQPLHLSATLHSGQAFRWQRDGDWSYGVVFGNVIKLRQKPGGIEFFSAPDDERTLEPMLHNYLGLETDLESIYASFADDQRLEAAIARHKGMRILTQDPWECLVAFICSSASNIPRINKNVESLCSSFGQPVALDDHIRKTFPTPPALAEAGERYLRDLGLGYRARYLAATARAIADGKLDLMALRESGYHDALNALTALDGVGDKVANCVLLFSLDKLDAFPVDVWVHRALQEWYFDGRHDKMSRKKMRLWARDHFGSYAGYANHYLFHDRRLQNRG